MNISFLGQGFEEKSPNAVGNFLIDFLNRKEFDSFTGIVAFASESGVYGLSKHLKSAKANFKNLNLIVGIDLGGTSKEALEEVLDLDINSYIFYQMEQVVFHPKIYLFEGSRNIKLIIGSSNLTTSGLFTNVESSILFEFDTDDKDGQSLLSEIKSYYKSIFDFSDPNLFKINKSLILFFFQLGVVIDEKTRKALFMQKPKLTSISTKITVATPISKVPKRNMAKVPTLFHSKTNMTSTTKGYVFVKTTPLRQQKDLVWQKRSLSKSDAQMVKKTTKPTGNLKLSQAFFKLKGLKIDQTSYFRDIIFKHITWIKTKANSTTYEEAQCSFDITILGNYIGSFVLKLSHDSVRIAGQSNVPTWLHWGNSLMPFLLKYNITRKSFNLYQENKKFIIEIV
ncbi:phospholipase D family protein [Sphingobacterium faecium]|uniref:phospholipase D family protein n=1 Tax=Sphingobacterium faecium TaxID=34087 RepID=UPI00320ACDC8